MKFVDELERLGIQPGNGTGVLGIDLSAYFPYTNQEILILTASLSELPNYSGITFDIDNNCVFNHRYPNTGYKCMTGKVGRKRCSFGVPVCLPYEKLNAFKYLNIGYGFARGCSDVLHTDRYKLIR